MLHSNSCVLLRECQSTILVSIRKNGKDSCEKRKIGTLLLQLPYYTLFLLAMQLLSQHGRRGHLNQISVTGPNKTFFSTAKMGEHGLLQWQNPDLCKEDREGACKLKKKATLASQQEFCNKKVKKIHGIPQFLMPA